MILGPNGFDLAEYYRAHGLRSYAGTAHPRLPNRWEIVGPLGFVGFAWPDFVEIMAAHAVRIIDEAAAEKPTRRSQPGRLQPVEHPHATPRQGHPPLPHRLQPGLRTYFVNSQQETVYHRPQTITGARRFSRRSPVSDYQFSRRPSIRIPHRYPRSCRHDRPDTR